MISLIILRHIKQLTKINEKHPERTKTIKLGGV